MPVQLVHSTVAVCQTPPWLCDINAGQDSGCMPVQNHDLSSKRVFLLPHIFPRGFCPQVKHILYFHLYLFNIVNLILWKKCVPLKILENKSIYLSTNVQYLFYFLYLWVLNVQVFKFFFFWLANIFYGYQYQYIGETIAILFNNLGKCL